MGKRKLADYEIKQQYHDLLQLVVDDIKEAKDMELIFFYAQRIWQREQWKDRGG